MINDDVKLLARLEPVVRRVLIVDANMHSARLLADLMKGMGAREIVFESDQKGAIEVIRDFEPSVMFVERSGPRFDGEALVGRLRRSSLSSRQIPVIMVTAEATASTIKGARDVGVHEFMVKPFTTGDLIRRLVNVATKPRPWVEAMGYVGPDRRRFNSGEYRGTRKRQSEAQALGGTMAEDTDRAGKIILSALNQFDNDPPQARRALVAQGEILKNLAGVGGQSALAKAAADLTSAAQCETAGVDVLRGPAVAVLALVSAGRGAAAA
ncbi:MAG: response regulator [Caulobacterales bacterium]|nr:response regulator [Caulobacterales bacterium]